MQQVHGHQVALVTEATDERLPGIDGVLTRQAGLSLAVRHADCLPIVLYHPSGIIGAVHAGRRGTQQQILIEALKLAQTQTQTAGQWEIWFGPAICKECYEVNRTTGEHVDLLAENQQQLDDYLGPENYTLTLDTRCTCHQTAEYYSYRREGQGVPMNWTVVTLEQPEGAKSPA